MMTISLADQSFVPDLAAFDDPNGWEAHPSFAGVHLKTLVSGAQSQGRLKTLLVRLAPGARMLTHVHPAQTEQHFVLSGAGKACVGASEIDYRLGHVEIIPPDTQHSILAADRGMMLLAVFSPAAG